MIKSIPLFARIASCCLSVCMLSLTLVFPNYALAQDDIKAERVEKPQVEAQTEAPVMHPSRIMKVGPGQSRTLRQMEETQLAFPQELEEVEIGAPGSTINPWEYAAQKAAANRSRVTSPFQALLETLAPEVQAPPILQAVNVAGTAQVSTWPPDTHGAVGNAHFVEVTNRAIDIFNLAGAKLVPTKTLATFFNYTTKSLFDPRVVYDKNWDRFVVTAEAFQETTTVQNFFIAISQTSNPTGAWWLYKFDINYLNDIDEFFDFPQLGMDQNSIIITANIFEGSPMAFKTGRMFSIAKSRLYNGLSFSVPIFSGLAGSLAPPIVLDQNAKTFLIAAPTSGAALKLYTLRDSSSASCTGCTSQTLTGPVNVAVAAYTVPPNALQPAPCTGATHDLDTSDSRFSNASTQNQNYLYQIHTINVGGRAKPRWYQINTTTNAVFRTSVITTGASTFDFNASIAANELNDVFVTYSSASTAIRAQVRFTGRRSTDPNAIPIGGLAFTSVACITGNLNSTSTGPTAQRWGDYSAVSVDPNNSLRAYLVNENVNSASLWGSRIVRFGF